MPSIMPSTSVSPESQIDLFIIGAGPAGLMLAAWASQYDISVRIIDDKSSRTRTGQADGLQSRTLEILQSFGLADRFRDIACHVDEICSWNPDPDDAEKIVRTSRAKAQMDGLSRYGQIGLNQGLTEQILLDYLASRGRVEVERSVTPESMQIDEGECEDDDDAYPCTITLRTLAVGKTAAKYNSSSSADRMTVRAKYVVGCDGAHSWLRRQLNIPLEGDATNKHFGVMDIVPLTDFPDIRESCIIHSNSGSVMTVPREGRLLRLYVQLGETAEGNRFDKTTVTPQTILARARPMLAPYRLDFKVCDWQSVYTIGQRVAPRFSYANRIFLAGDAVHTHSPTMGQGMNVSMQDTYNLGWKLGAVLTRTSPRSLLATYDAERRPVANELIELDRRMSRFYSDGPSVESKGYQAFRDEFSKFLSGVTVGYGASMAVAGTRKDSMVMNGDVHKHVNGEDRDPDSPSTTSNPTLAGGIHTGQRFASHKIVNQSDANVVHLHDLLPSNGKWRIVVLAGDLTDSTQFDKVQNLGVTLSDLCTRYTRPKEGLHSTLEVLTLHSGDREAVRLLHLHNVFHPWDERLGWDYWKVFSDDARTFEPGCESAYDLYGVDRGHGCLVVLRPDQHVAYVGSLEDGQALERLFGGVLVPRCE